MTTQHAMSHTVSTDTERAFAEARAARLAANVTAVNASVSDMGHLTTTAKQEEVPLQKGHQTLNPG